MLGLIVCIELQKELDISETFNAVHVLTIEKIRFVQ